MSNNVNPHCNLARYLFAHSCKVSSASSLKGIPWASKPTAYFSYVQQDSCTARSSPGSSASSSPPSLVLLARMMLKSACGAHASCKCIINFRGVMLPCINFFGLAVLRLSLPSNTNSQVCADLEWHQPQRQQLLQEHQQQEWPPSQGNLCQS